jgi:outer membrane protein TolC
MQKHLTTVGLLACLLGDNPVFAQTTHRFTVQQTVDHAIKNSFTIKNALIGIQQQQQTNREVTALALPQATGSVSLNRFINIPVQSVPNFISAATYGVLVDEGVKDGSGNPIQLPNGGNFGTLALAFGVPWTASAGVDVSQILFDGQVFVGLQARNAAMQMARQTAEVTSEQIKANVQKIYYQLVVGQQQLGSVIANIERFEKLLKDTRAIYDQGFAERLDVDKVQVQLNNLKTERTKIENQLTNGNAGLKFLINLPQKDTLLLTDSLTEDVLKTDILEAGYNYTDRKDIQLLQTVTRLQGYNVKRYQLSAIPSLVAFGSYSKNAQRTQFNFFDKGDWFTTFIVGLKLNVPIFDGFARRARLENARLELQKSTNQLEQTKQLMDMEAAQYRRNMTNAVLTADAQRENLELAEKVYQTTKKKYEQGLGSNQEIYNAQTELKVAQNNYYGSLYDAISAKIDYLKATGKL